MWPEVLRTIRCLDLCKLHRQQYFVESEVILHLVTMLLVFWVLTLVGPSNQYCWGKSSSIFCSNTDPLSFLQDVFHLRNTINNKFGFSYELEITQSKFPHIYSFPRPLPYGFILEKLALTHSSVEVIEDDAFENFPSLVILMLSNNRLKNLTFVETLPTNLEELYLDRNDFNSVSNVFRRLNKLRVVDLSGCKISVISNDSFMSFFHLIDIKLSDNQLTSFDAMFRDGVLVNKLDLSFNKLKSMYCRFSKVSFFMLNFSSNSLETLKNCNFDMASVVDFSFNNLSRQSNLNHFHNAHTLNLVSCGIEDTFHFETLATSKYVLDLSNNNIKTVRPFMFGNMSNVEIDSLLLVNSSINTISSNAFSNFRMAANVTLINISSNPVNELKDYTFNNTRIQTVDISNCAIEKIQNDAFSGLLLTNTLNLSHNRITFLNNKLFDSLPEMQTLDLSYNELKKLDNQLFENCRNLRVLDLSHSKIEVIRKYTFTRTLGLDELYLQNNLIDKIEFGTYPLTVLNLEHNRLSNLQFSFAENLASRVIRLTGNNIGQLVNNSGSMMCCTREILASNSNITSIEERAFRGLTSLEVLDLSDNRLEKIVSGTFVGLKRLVLLDLKGNKLSFFSENAFVFGNQLKTFHISFFGDWKGEMLTNLNFLTTLNVVNSNISLLERNSFKGLFFLEKVNFDNANISSVASGAFNGLDSLGTIDFHSCFNNLAVVEARHFEGLSKLSDLHLFGLNITSLEAESFAGLNSLQTLSLNDNKIKTILNNTFLGLKSLKSLNLSSNRISSLEIQAFYGLDNLDELFLSNNNITGPALGTFQNFPNLRILNLSRNNISILLTGTFSNLKEVIDLDLSFNNITRLEVHDIISLRSLQRLDVTQNHLIQIEYLDLVKLLRQLKFMGINNNKWKCDDLVKMLAVFRKYNIEWVSTKSMTLLEENINGIKCFDICKFFYCV